MYRKVEGAKEESATDLEAAFLHDWLIYKMY